MAPEYTKCNGEKHDATTEWKKMISHQGLKITNSKNKRPGTV